MLSRIIHTQVHEKLPASGLAAYMNTLKLKVTSRSMAVGWAQEQEIEEKLELLTLDETAIHCYFYLILTPSRF